MKIRNNEHGNALLMVLLLVLVFTILGMGLLSMNISAAKQFNKKEEQVQARHLAEMGVLHNKEKIQETVTDYNDKIAGIVERHISSGKSLKELKGLLNGEFSSFCKRISNTEFAVLDNKSPITGDYSTDNISDNEADVCEILEEEVIVTFKSIGNSGGYEEFINATITIIPSGLNEYFPENSNTVTKLGPSGTVYTNPITVLGNQSLNNKVSYTFNDTVIFMGNVTLNTAGGSKAAPVIEAKKDLYVGGKLVLKQHNNINVGGDLAIVDNLNMGNHSCIAVNGHFTTKMVTLEKHSVLSIYGNGSFDKIPSGGSIYIEGKLIVGGKEVQNTFNKKVNNGMQCNNSADFPDSGGSNSGKQVKIRWDIADNLDATYNE